MRILRAKSFTSPKTPRRTNTAIDKSFHDPSLLRRVTSKARIVIKKVNDPFNDPLSRPVADQFTNNPNPKYDPSKAPSGVQIKKVSPAPLKEETGHQKEIVYNNQQRTGGKTLRRR